jgi:hypothetical protein
MTSDREPEIGSIIGGFVVAKITGKSIWLRLPRGEAENAAFDWWLSQSRSF